MFFKSTIKYNLSRDYYIKKIAKRRDSLKLQDRRVWDQIDGSYLFSKIGTKDQSTRKQGDIFYCEPFDNVRVFGKVIQANISNTENSFVDKCHVVVFSFCPNLTLENINSKGIDISDLSISLYLSDLLIIDDALWQKGYFKSLFTMPLTKKEQKISIGFFAANRVHFCTAQGEELKSHPILEGYYSYTTIFGITFCILQGLLLHAAELQWNVVELLVKHNALKTEQDIESVALRQYIVDQVYCSELNMSALGAEQLQFMENELSLCGNGYEMDVIFDYIVQKYYPLYQDMYEVNSSAQFFLLLTENKELHEIISKLFRIYIFDFKTFSDIVQKVDFEY